MFPHLVRQPEPLDLLADRLFDATLKAQLDEPERARDCVQVITRLRNLA